MKVGELIDQFMTCMDNENIEIEMCNGKTGKY